MPVLVDSIKAYVQKSLKNSFRRALQKTKRQGAASAVLAPVSSALLNTVYHFAAAVGIANFHPPQNMVY